MTQAQLTKEDAEKMEAFIRFMAPLALQQQQIIRTGIEAMGKQGRVLLTMLTLFAIAAAIAAAYISNTSPVVIGLVVFATTMMVTVLVLKALHIL